MAWKFGVGLEGRKSFSVVGRGDTPILCFLLLHIMFALLGGEPFDGIAQGRTRHVSVSAVEEPAQAGLVLLAHLAQHPARGFANQVVFVMEQQVGQREGVVEVAPSNPLPGGNDGDALFPQQLALSQPVEWGVVAVFEVGSHDLSGREVYQVPVVDAVGMGQVGFIQGCSPVVVGMLELFDHAQEGSHAQLVYRTVQQLHQFGEWCVAIALGNGAGGRYRYSDEDIVFAILPFSGFEESGEDFYFFGVGDRSHGILYPLGCVHDISILGKGSKYFEETDFFRIDSFL